MPETVAVRCPACRREHRYTAPAYPCACGAPVAPRLDRDGSPTPVSHRVWKDDWVTVRCGSCGRHGEWPHPEVGCSCGVVLRVAVVEGAVGIRDQDSAPAGGASPGESATAGRATADGQGKTPAGDTADAQGKTPARHSADAQDKTTARHTADTQGTTATPDTADDQGRTTADMADAAGTTTTPDTADAQGKTTAREATAGRNDTGGQDAAPRLPPPAGPREAATAGTSVTGDAVSATGAATSDAASARPPFRSVTIRTALDAVTATALYLRWLGYRGVRRADQRPPSGIGLAARGVVAQVDPAVRPAGLRDVECLWLTAMTESADCLYFSLAGYAADARARADALGVPLFVLDLTGTPRPVNAPAEALAATGLENRA